jgi:pimeloyl-ACP methyl ester carboxylesterase
VSGPAGAVFVSYASQDAEAALRIGAALRAGGIEVWIDSSELRGGEAWDAAIRQQIKTCRLFMPVISRHTQGRDEGYFRLEWKLAIDRSHLMAKTRPFLVPVVIDDCPSDEQVPDGFREIHWTQLPDGNTGAEFVQRVAELLAHSAVSTAPPIPASAGPPIRQQIRFAQAADGTRIAFATCGSGYPLVAAAHWLGHLEFDLQTPVWLPWIERASASYALTRYDSRGCGLSDRRVADYLLDEQVSDLECVVQATGLERFALFASSQGGPISIAYAVRHPDRVSHLVLCGAFARGLLRRDDSAANRANTAALANLIRVGWGKRNPAFRQMFTSLFFPRATAEQMDAFNEIQRRATSPEHAARILDGVSNLDASPYLEQVTTPTLVIHCRGDALVPLEEGRYLASNIKGARFEPLESHNHIPLAGEPAFERVFQLLREFLPVTPTA